MYITFVDTLEYLSCKLKWVVDIPLRSVFSLPFKWESQASPVEASWCEATIQIYEHGVTLRRKDVPLMSSTPLTPLPEWLRWVSQDSPNAKTALASMLPSLLRKSVWYASSTLEFLSNVDAVLWGIGWHSYPRAWWKPQVCRFFKAFGLDHLYPFPTIHSRVRDGVSVMTE